MRTIDSKSFNETVLKDIEHYKWIFDNSLTPENFLYFPSTRIDRNRDKYRYPFDPVLGYDKEEARHIDYDYNCNINSVEVSRIKTAINYLKTNKTEIHENIFEFNPYIGMSAQAISDKDDIKYKHTIRVPESYDGRNCYIEYVISAYDKSGTKGNIVKKHGARICHFTPEQFMTMFSNGANKAQNKSLTSVKIYKNKHEVTIDMRYPNRNIEDSSSSPNIFLYAKYIWVKGRAIFWRNV